MSTQPARGYLGISEVLAELRADFPDISVSKIRFLETEGLIAPARSPSGYRRFCGQDVDRLRIILAAQRDQYLPLRVIKERLARLDQQRAAEQYQAADRAGPAVRGAFADGGPAGGGSPAARPTAGGQAGGWQAGVGQAGGSPAPGGPAGGGPAAAGSASAGLMGGLSTDGRQERAAGRPGTFGQPRVAATAAADPLDSAEPGPLLSRRELVDAAGLSDALLTELETFGLIRRIGRHYSPEALEVARTAKSLTSFGVEARHLRAVRAAAERETTMIESLVAPILRQRGAGARELAARTARDCAVLVLRLHRALVEGTLSEAGLPAGSLGPAAGAQADDVGNGNLRGQARGVEGASA